VATQTLTNPDCRRVRVASLRDIAPKLKLLDFEQGAGGYCHNSHRVARSVGRGVPLYHGLRAELVRGNQMPKAATALSIQGQTGLDLTLGVSGLELRRFDEGDDGSVIRNPSQHSFR
jgi:hypothetical protein